MANELKRALNNYKKNMDANRKEGNYVSIKSPDWVAAIVEVEKDSWRGEKFAKIGLSFPLRFYY